MTGTDRISPMSQSADERVTPRETRRAAARNEPVRRAVGRVAAASRGALPGRPHHIPRRTRRSRGTAPALDGRHVVTGDARQNVRELGAALHANRRVELDRDPQQSAASMHSAPQTMPVGVTPLSLSVQTPTDRCCRHPTWRPADRRNRTVQSELRTHVSPRDALRRRVASAALARFGLRCSAGCSS